MGGWASTVSGMSAPWLAIAFVAGMTQEGRNRAMVIGLIVTMSALLGYFAMTYSPMENVPFDRFFEGIGIMVRTNALWVVGGAVTGPLYGFLGHRWRVSRSWVSAALITLALCVEPLARHLVDRLAPYPYVWVAEVAVGVLAAAAFAFAAVRRGRGTAPPLAPGIGP